jgi:hypothetical protein
MEDGKARIRQCRRDVCGDGGLSNPSLSVDRDLCLRTGLVRHGCSLLQGKIGRVRRAGDAHVALIQLFLPLFKLNMLIDAADCDENYPEKRG